MISHPVQKNDEAPAPQRRATHHAICGTGEMADLTRAFNWSKTSVGPVEQGVVGVAVEMREGARSGADRNEVMMFRL